MNTTLSLCNRCETPIEAGDLRCSICGQGVPVETETRDRVEVQILRCTGCGAAVAFDPEHQAPSCSFCESVFRVETVEDPMEQSEGFLPFTIDRDEARRALTHWLGTLGWFRPSDLKSAARLEELKPIWWVGWVFDAEALVSWTADSNAGSRRSSWAPHSGQVGMEFDDILASASRGLSNAEAAVVGPACDLRSLRSDPEGASDAIIEQFDVQRSQARVQIVDAIQQTAAHRVEAQQIPGSRFRHVRAVVLLRRLVTRRLSFPAWVLAYRYKRRLYRVVICGQDGSRVSGSAPYSIAKIALVIAACVGALLAIGGAILASQ